jgi:DNA-binding NtrC family response regulator
MLNGQTALVVEEEFLIALDIQRMLELMGAGQTLFASTPGEAEHFRARWPELGIAVVEIRHRDEAAIDLVERLRSAGIPTVLTTADLDIGQTRDLADLALLPKPIPEDEMTSAVRQALAARL